MEGWFHAWYKNRIAEKRWRVQRKRDGTFSYLARTDVRLPSPYSAAAPISPDESETDYVAYEKRQSFLVR